MKRFQGAIITIFAAVALTAAFSPSAGAFLLVATALSGLVILAIYRTTDEPETVTKIFLVALACRLAAGLFIHYFDLRGFFGGDANTYDTLGHQLALIWTGNAPVLSPFELHRTTSMSGPGWGMNYFVGAVYYIFGRNILIPQTICGVLGAATTPAVYVLSQKLYENKRVARTAAILIAVMPAMVIWSSQLMKDGLVLLFLVVATIAVLKLQERLSILAVAILGLCLFGILSLRFYIFYMVAVAAIGSLVIGASGRIRTMLPRLAALAMLGVGLTYFGVIRIASTDIGRATDLQNVQRSRLDLARSADSGFSEESDVSTPEGAITTIPVGLTFLFLAPFPWMAANLRQAITIPETLLWYATIPFIFSGLLYTIRRRFSRALPILIFTVMLSIAYAIFQGNVGTAYRQRTQIQVFLYIFAAVGIELILEKRRDRQMLTSRAMTFQPQAAGVMFDRTEGR
ncbi:MAG TPA: glycosyltransferase family 39 protein [Pyrinomonadaceae bacterium]|nr:glycosyltransferase family 39 protein [Pyrinomonadaceae bacterium]